MYKSILKVAGTIAFYILVDYLTYRLLNQKVVGQTNQTKLMRSLNVLGIKWKEFKKLTPKEKKQTIKSAYRNMVKKYHPDLGGSADDFRNIQEAYEFAYNF